MKISVSFLPLVRFPVATRERLSRANQQTRRWNRIQHQADSTSSNRNSLPSLSWAMAQQENFSGET